MKHTNFRDNPQYYHAVFLSLMTNTIDSPYWRSRLPWLDKTMLTDNLTTYLHEFGERRYPVTSNIAFTFKLVEQLNEFALCVNVDGKEADDDIVVSDENVRLILDHIHDAAKLAVVLVSLGGVLTNIAARLSSDLTGQLLADEPPRGVATLHSAAH